MRPNPDASLRCRLAIAGILTLGITNSQAAGFALIEQSGSGMGNAFAGAAAAAEDASTIFFNPAGLTRLERRELVAAGHIVGTSSEFSGSATDALGNAVATGGDGGDAGDTSLVPNLYYSMPVNNSLTFGIGLNVPFGLKTEYDDNWVGRYHAIKSEVKTLNINPTIAYQAMPKLALGFGISAQYIEAELTQAVDQGSNCILLRISQLGEAPAAAAANCAGIDPNLTPQGDDANAKVEGDDWSFGFNFGLIYDITDHTRVGFAYRSKVDQELEGDASFTNANAFFTAQGIFVPTSVTADVTLPENASLSLYHEMNDRWTLLADATWTRWSQFDELRVEYASNQSDTVTPENWENVMRYSLGLNYQYDSRILLRAGVAFDEEPIPDAAHRTPRIPGNDRRWLALGASYDADRNLRFDVGYAHLFISDPGINHSSTTAGTITGEYDSSVDLLSAQAVWRF